MKTLGALAAGLVLSVGAVAPASADLPSNVHRGPSIVFATEWGRVLCASSDDGLRCAIRVPGRFSRFDVTANRGDLYVDMKAWSFPRVARTYSKPQRVAAHVMPGVHMACTAHGNYIACAFDLESRFEGVKVQVFSAGVSQGTMNGNF